MAVIDTGQAPYKTPIEVANGNQVVPFFSENTELSMLFVHVIVRDVDNFPITLDFYQGNINNGFDKDTNTIIGDDLLAPIDIVDTSGNQIPLQETITENGNYVYAIDTFYGKWGEIRIDVGVATTGTIRVITNTVKKV